jgi:phosphoglucomutase
VAHATQGLANLILKEGRADDGVVIAYDSRNNSPLFARTAASVLAANGNGVYLFDALRPTPELSFALRFLKCVAGINITASDNPKAYNGCKAYWEDGAQLRPEHATVVSEEIGKLDIFNDIKTVDVDTAIADGRIRMISEEIDEAYLREVQAQAINPEAIRAVADDLHIVYTPLHGAGYRLVPEILARCGLKHLHPVVEQMQPNGDFPTVAKPNPEYPEVFEIGTKLANEVGSDLIIATDPDTDRVGVSTRRPDGSFTTITGNQMGALLIDYIITAYEQTGTMPEGPYAVKTIVTSEMAAKICAVASTSVPLASSDGWKVKLPHPNHRAPSLVRSPNNSTHSSMLTVSSSMKGVTILKKRQGMLSVTTATNTPAAIMKICFNMGPI